MRSIVDCLKGTGHENNEVEYFFAKCYNNYLYFAEHILGFEIADYHREWYEMAEKYNRLVIVAFRGSGKTFFFSGYMLWKCVFQGPREILIISKTDNQAKKVLKVIRNFILDNEILKQFAPKSKEAIWRATELEMSNGSLILCKPYNENIRTWHPDDILLDEIGEYEDKSIYWTAVLGAIQIKMGRVIGIGTPKSASDLLAELKVNDEYFHKDYPAEVDGKVLWDQKYTLLPYDTDTKKSLKKIRREMGELPYQQEYMLKPISDANSLFPYELISQCISSNEGFLPFGRKNERYFVGYDIARTPKGDYTVFTVIGDNGQRKKLVKAYRFRDTFEEQIRILKNIYEDFHPVKLVADGTGLGDKQARDIEMEFDGVEVLKVTYDSKHKLMMDLRREFERLNLVLPNSKNDESYNFTQQLVKELNEIAMKVDLRPGNTTRPKFFSGKHDDCVNSLAYANRASQNPFGQVSFRPI